MGDRRMFEAHPDIVIRAYYAYRPTLEALAEVSVPAEGEWTATVSRGGRAEERYEELLAHLPAARRDQLRHDVAAVLRGGRGALTDGQTVWTEDRVPPGMLYFVHPPVAAAS